MDIPHYVRPSNYNKILEQKGYLTAESGKPQEERRRHNRALLERLYRQREIDFITKYRHYELAEEDVKYLKSLRYKRHKSGEDEPEQ